MFVSSTDLWDWQETESSQNFLLPLYSWFATLILLINNNNTKMIHVTCHSFIQDSLQQGLNLPVPSYPSQVLLWTGLREAQAQAVLLVGPALCFLLRLFSLSEVVHRTPPSSRPAPKSLWSHACHSSPLLNLEMVFSFLTLFWLCISISLFTYASPGSLAFAGINLRALLLDHDSHLKDVFMLTFIICREICSN